MNQVKIGTFIAVRRKQKNLTQMQLAEKLNITDRAVSKWERGKSLPDSSIMIDLCKILGISVTELLSGEEIPMENHNKDLENHLLEMIKQKEQADKRLLSAEVFIGITATVVLFALIVVAAFVQMETWLKISLIAFGFILFFAGCFYALRMEQTAGYYECKACGHRYIPDYKSVLWAPHMGRTRKMTCPKCEMKTWQKKVISKENVDAK